MRLVTNWKGCGVRGARHLVWVLGVVIGVLAVTGTAGAAATPAAHFGHVTCRGGAISVGTYESLRVAGACMLSNSGTTTVEHDVTVARNGFLNAITPGTLKVRGDLIVRAHGAAGVGCSPAVGCNVTTSDVIGGSVLARGAWAVVIHSAWIGGSVSMTGGGGSQNCNSTALAGGPYFSDFEDNTIRGDVVVRRLHTCWFGFIRNHVGGTVRLIGGRFGDPDAMEIVTNWIGGNLACFNNNPPAHVGDSMGSPNVVGGQKRGECKGPGL